MIRCLPLPLLFALLPCAAQLPPAEPVLVTGAVPDAAAKALLLGRLREVFGAERVVDQLRVGGVAAAPDWAAQLHALLGPGLKQVSKGSFTAEGRTIRLQGQAPDAATAALIAGELTAKAGTAYTVSSALQAAAQGQHVLDAALGKRIVEFERGKATLTPAGSAILDDIAQALLKLGDRKMEIIGHTDNSGSPASNVALSQARAQAVKAYLAGRGVKPEMVATEGRGPDEPVADNGTEAGRARNRRIEFRLL